jgi:hypothetical protein
MGDVVSKRFNGTALGGGDSGESVTLKAADLPDHLPPDNVREVDFYTGTSFAVGELALSYRQLDSAIRDLANGNARGIAVDQKLAAERIQKITGQMNILSSTLVRVSVNHLNRRPRA